MLIYLVYFVLQICGVQGAYDISFETDEDLTSFVSRPDIKAPLFDVAIYDNAAVLPGFWFITPYADIKQQQHARNYYQACQTGPAIYDSQGVRTVEFGLDISPDRLTI